MTPLEKAAKTIADRCYDFPQALEIARIVAEALFSETPEPERMKVMEDQLEGALLFRKIAARCAYAAERKWIGL